jgi:hypothetical protein
MYRQQSRKQVRLRGQRSQRSGSNPVIPPQLQHNFAHPQRPPRQLPMHALVFVQLPLLHGIRQRQRLPERQSQSFARNCVHSSRSIPGQRNIPAPYSRQGLHRGNRSSLLAAQFRDGNT